MGAALRTVRTPRARVDARTRIGLAWFTSRLPGVGSFAWHNGISSGFTSFAAYVLARQGAAESDATLGVRHG